ncbi:MAG: O-antigen ligase family protein [Patescibacteria group bacterium]
MKTEKLLRQALIALLFLVPFIPLIVANPLFFPFITGKNFAFRVLVEFAFGLWILLALKDPSTRPRRSALFGALLLFIATLGISTFLGENPSKSFWSNFERMEGWISVLHWGAYFVVLTSVFTTERIWRAFWTTSIGVSVILGIYGLFQLGGFLPINQGGVRVDATFGNATYLAVYMLFSAFVTMLALTRWARGPMMKAGYALALALQLIMIYYTATRGTILGLVGGLFLAGLILIIFGKGNAALRKWGAGAAAVVLLIVGSFFLFKDSEFVKNNEVLQRFASISLSEASTRFTIWSMAVQGALERPVFGWGQEGFNYVFNEYYDASLYKQEQWFDRAHNQYLDWLVAGGFLGFALYGSFYLILLWYLWRTPKSLPVASVQRAGIASDNGFDVTERALMTGLLAGYAFHNLFVFDNLMSSVLFLSLMAYLTMRARPADEPAPKGAQLAGTPWYAGAAILAVTVVIVYAANAPGITRASNLIEALKPKTENLAPNLEYFKKTLTGGGIGRQEAHEQLMQFATELGTNQNLIARSTPQFRAEVFAYTAGKLAEEVAREPNDARVQLFYGAFLHQIGDIAGAQAPLLKAQELSPQKQAILFELGILALDAGNAEGALEWLRTAYELEPSYDQARIYYAMVAIRVGRRDIADALLMERYGTVTPDNDYVLQAYLDIKEYDIVVRILETRVAGHPDDAQVRLNLAAAYLQADRRQESVSAIREAIRLNPAFKTQGEEYIRIIESGQNP